jgi:HNH endonuclease
MPVGNFRNRTCPASQSQPAPSWPEVKVTTQKSSYRCELLIRAKMVPDRAGSDTRVDVQIPLSALRGLDGASAVEEAWLRARAGQHGYLAGQDADVIACDALIVPVVTGSPDWNVIAQIITLVSEYHTRAHGGGGPGQPPGEPARPLWVESLPPQAQEALLYAVARLAIDFVSGPGGIASALRRTLLGAQLNGKSVPLDVGYSDHIPDAIRRAVIRRDQHCAWPAGCDRPAAVSDVHHITHKKDGGPTSVKDCMLLCQYHHDICIHRWGWKIELLPDGSVRATGPQGQVIQSHPPPTIPIR